MFYLQLTSTLTIHVPNSISVEFLLFIKLQCIVFDSTCINARMDTSDNGMLHNFKRSQGGCEWFDRHQIALVMCLFFFHWS